MTGQELKKMRVSSGVPQKVLAANLRVSQSHISLWEREEKPIPDKQAERIVKFLTGFVLPSYIDPPGGPCNLSKESLNAIGALISKAVLEITLHLGPSNPLRGLRIEEMMKDRETADRVRKRCQEKLNGAI